MEKMKLTKLVVFQLSLFVCTLIWGINLYGQSVDYSLKFNPNTGNYEAYARPDFTDASFIVAGGSQFSLVLPASIADTPLSISSVNGGP